MSKSTDEFNYKALQDRESIVKYLNALLEGFSNGRLLFGVKDQQLILEPQGLIELDVEGERKDGKTKLRLKFQWREERHALQRPSDNDLVISSDKAPRK